MTLVTFAHMLRHGMYDQALSAADWAQIISALGTMVAAVVAVIAAVQSYRSAKQNNETNEQMIRPRVVVYIENSENNISFMDLVIRNEGGGLARDVIFRVKGDDLPMSFSDGKDKHLSDFDVIKSGIKVIPAGITRRYFILSMSGQVEQILALKCTVEIEYKNSTRNKLYKDSFDLDFASLPKMKFTEKEISNQKKIAGEIEKIRKVLEKKK